MVDIASICQAAGLPEKVLKEIQDAKFSEPTPIQVEFCRDFCLDAGYAGWAVGIWFVFFWASDLPGVFNFHESSQL